MAKHECKPATGCCCYQLADEPDEDCPQHGYPIPRCNCGRFVSRKPLALEPDEPQHTDCDCMSCRPWTY